MRSTHKESTKVLIGPWPSLPARSKLQQEPLLTYVIAFWKNFIMENSKIEGVSFGPRMGERLHDIIQKLTTEIAELVQEMHG